MRVGGVALRLKAVSSLRYFPSTNKSPTPPLSTPNIFTLSLISSSSSSSSMAASDEDSVTYGFNRPEMYSTAIGNTVDFYERHVFFCYKDAQSWPSKVEGSVEDPVAKLLFSAIKDRKNDFPLKTRLTLCGGCNGTEFSDGDVLIFPDMVKYKGLKEVDVDAFVDDVLVNGKPLATGVPETLVGAYVFVCAHASRDKRCGICGPVLIEKFKEAIESRSLDDRVFVNSCSHIGGHKYAGNVIIFGTNGEGKVIGDWYGYVTPDDVPHLIDIHIGKGEIIEKLWRGQMGLKVEAAEKGEEKTPSKELVLEETQDISSKVGRSEITNVTSCCQGPNGVSCCRDGSEGNADAGGGVDLKKPSESSGCLPGFMGNWEQSDVLMAAAVAGAVATVAVAYGIFRRSS